MAEGNRKDPRARVLNMTVRYKSATVDEFIENHSHDISRGGIFIKTRSPFPAGTLLKFEVRIAEDQKLMHGVGRVVWRREADRAEESFPAGMGIKFIKTGDGATDLINQLVAARQGAESSFDAGVRENVSTPGAGRPSLAPPAPAASLPPTAPITPLPASGPALSVDSAPRSLPASDTAETAVTNPAKKRQHVPEKRKVVLQGPALEAPSSKPPAVPLASPSEEERAPSRDRGSIAEETTAKRQRPARPPVKNDSPSVLGLVAILAVLGLIVLLVTRGRSSVPKELPPAVTAEPAPVAPAPAPAAPAPEPQVAEAPAELAEPAAEEAAAPGAGGAPAVAGEAPNAAAAGAPVDLAAGAAGTPSVGSAGAAASVESTTSPAPAAPAPAAGATPPVPTPAAPAQSPSPTAAPAKAAPAAAAPAQPAPAKPAPAPAPRAAAPKPQPAPAQAPKAAAPAPAAGSPAAAPKPPPAAPAPPAPAPPAPAADDNPY
jgi:uncharacterized protein (TIGR02266 family)